MFKSLFISLMVVVGTASIANANLQELTILRNQKLKGSQSFDLRQLTVQQLRAQGKNPQNFQLEAVRMVAKSFAGHGKATLTVGFDSETKGVPMAFHEAGFFIDAPFTYHNIDWDLGFNQGSVNEAWTMNTRGRINIDRLFVYVSRRHHGNPGNQLQRVRVPLNDQMFSKQGQNIIYIKQALRNMGYDLRNAKLRRLTLVGKSARGQAQVQPLIGNSWYWAQNVPMPANGWDFQSNRPRSYNRLNWQFNGKTQGRWQLHFIKGRRIKAKAVIVEFR